MDSIVEQTKQIHDEKRFTVSARFLLNDELRLDASYYTQDVQKALRTIKASNFKFEKLENFSHRIFYPARSKRLEAPDNTRNRIGT
jgi:hypothetical protein